MIPDGAKITGVVLAGGRGARMGGQDKGLVLFRGRPMAEYAVAALQQVAERVLISANRNAEEYARLGHPVIADTGDGFQGPLAGLLAALRAAQTPYVLSVPCDAPLIEGTWLKRLLDTLAAENADICVAHDGRRMHPVFAVVRVSLASDLASYLESGGRKVETWLRRHRLALADYSDRPGMFENVNSRDDLVRLEAAGRPAPGHSARQ